ncbi:MAG: protoporphyrinogen oxidase [Myxococcota bacterium]
MSPVALRPEGPPVVVVGGGVAGLATAWTLQRAGAPVMLLERTDEVGGVMGTRVVGGHRFETGPTTVMASAEEIGRLIDEVGLREHVVKSRPEAERRLIWRHGRLHELPSNPAALATSGLMTWKGKLRLLAEPFVSAPKEPRDETLAQMLRRRLGAEAVEGFVDPFVGGVFAGRVDELGVDAFPKLRDLEREHGGFVRGMFAKRKERKNGGPRKKGLLTFPEGLRELPDAIREALGTRVRLGHDVTRLERVEGDGAVAWRVHAQADGRGVTYDAAAVVLATPAWAAATLLEPLDEEAAGLLEPIPHPHVASIGLGYPEDAVEGDLNAFGLLTASDSPIPEDEPILGVLFNSSIFPGRAPEGHVTLTVMIGGARDPDAREASDGALVDRARKALAALVGARGEPTAVAVNRWPRAIPQYEPGHARRIERVLERIAGLGPLLLAGNYLEGVGVDPSVGTGFAAAETLLRAQNPSSASASATSR